MKKTNFKIRWNRVLGLILIWLGVALFLFKPLTSFTGFVIISDTLSVINELWFWFIGLAMITAGLMLTYEDRKIERIAEESRKYGETESKLKKILGRRFYDIKSEERPAYIKSYGGHLDKIGNEDEEKNIAVAVDTGQTTTESYKIIYTRKFEKNIRKHNLDSIENAINKINTGLGREEILKGRKDSSIRTSKGGRITFDINNTNKTILLKGYSTRHKYDL